MKPARTMKRDFATDHYPANTAIQMKSFTILFSFRVFPPLLIRKLHFAAKLVRGSTNFLSVPAQNELCSEREGALRTNKK